MSDGSYSPITRTVMGLAKVVLRVRWPNRQFYGVENLPREGPGIMLANHLRAYEGPLLVLEALLKHQIEVYPWGHGSLGTREDCATYIRETIQDQDEYQFLKYRLIKYLLSAIGSRVLPLILRDINMIPVHKDPRTGEGNSGFFGTLKGSVRLLEYGKILLIFPEKLFQDREDGVRPLNPGFGSLVESYLRRCNDMKPSIPLYPIVAHLRTGSVMSGTPIILTSELYEGLGDDKRTRRENLARILEVIMCGMYRRLGELHLNS